jgi:hypothetical protein
MQAARRQARGAEAQQSSIRIEKSDTTVKIIALKRFSTTTDLAA